MRLNLPLSGYVTSLKDTHIWAAVEGKIPRLLLMWCDKWLFIEIDIAWNIQMIGKPQDLRPENLWKIYAPSLESLSPGRKKPGKGLPRKVAIRCMICQLNTRHSFAGIWWLLTAQRHFPTPTWTPINTTQFQWELVGFKMKSYMHIEKVFILKKVFQGNGIGKIRLTLQIIEHLRSSKRVARVFSKSCWMYRYSF